MLVQPFVEEIREARVDGVETHAGFRVMEVEVNEPGLFFTLAPAAAETFADAVCRRLDG